MDAVHEAYRAAAAKGARIHLPVDMQCGDFKGNVRQFSAFKDIEDGWAMLDTGAKTAIKFGAVLRTARTIVWNGPMGTFENPPFDKGSKAILKDMAHATAKGAHTVVGGGDGVAFVMSQDGEGLLSHVSTGGGASIELLEGK